MERPSSWETSHQWYDRIVGKEGHYYHEKLLLPGTLRLLDLSKESSLLDLGCGQGILARHIPRGVSYVGVDLSSSLIDAAGRHSQETKHRFLVGDMRKPLSLNGELFTHSVLLLSLQNTSEPLMVFKNCAAHLKNKGKLLLILNHPCFRIPRQSSWGVDAAKKIQYRRVDRYLSKLEIPIQTHPGQKESPDLWSYHFPLSSYARWLKEAGFVIEMLEEWCSDKKSTGKHAAMEDLSRREFPLFLAILAQRE